MSTISRNITYLEVEIFGLVFLAALLACFLRSHLSLLEQLSWREIQIDQSELSGQAMKSRKQTPAVVEAEECDDFFYFLKICQS